MISVTLCGVSVFRPFLGLAREQFSHLRRCHSAPVRLPWVGVKRYQFFLWTSSVSTLIFNFSTVNQKSRWSLLVKLVELSWCFFLWRNKGARTAENCFLKGGKWEWGEPCYLCIPIMAHHTESGVTWFSGEKRKLIPLSAIKWWDPLLAVYCLRVSFYISRNSRWIIFNSYI